MKPTVGIPAFELKVRRPSDSFLPDFSKPPPGFSTPSLGFSTPRSTGISSLSRRRRVEETSPVATPRGDSGSVESPHLGAISPSLWSPSPAKSPRLSFKTKDVPECKICSTDEFEVCHPHISSQEIIRRYNAHNFFCPICRRKHDQHSSDGRISIVMGSSTLHNIWKCGTYRPRFHIDFDTIIGGRIHDVHYAFMAQYAELKRPMDVLLACGVNNMPTSDSAEDVIFQLKSFVKSVQNLSKYNSPHSRPNRVVISTILYAPKYCDNSLSQNCNMREKVRQVNAWIEKFNEENTGEHLRLHLRGVKGDPAVGPLEHRYDQWNEPQKMRKLHLNNETKAEVASDLLRVFENLKEK